MNGQARVVQTWLTRFKTEADAVAPCASCLRPARTCWGDTTSFNPENSLSDPIPYERPHGTSNDHAQKYGHGPLDIMPRVGKVGYEAANQYAAEPYGGQDGPNFRLRMH